MSLVPKAVAAEAAKRRGISSGREAAKRGGRISQEARGAAAVAGVDALRASRAPKKPQAKPSSDARGKGAKKGVVTSGRERVVASGSGAQEQAAVVEEQAEIAEEPNPNPNPNLNPNPNPRPHPNPDPNPNQAAVVEERRRALADLEARLGL